MMELLNLRGEFFFFLREGKTEGSGSWIIIASSHDGCGLEKHASLTLEERGLMPCG